MSEQNLQKAYSSKLSMVMHYGKKYVKKEIDREETKNEVYFFRSLAQAHLPSLQTIEENDGLLIEYIESVTLADHETRDTYSTYGSLIRRMHEITFSKPFSIDGDGNHHDISWLTFIEKQIEEGIVRQKERLGFSETEALRLKKEINQRLTENFQGRAALLHCDLHGNNVLVQEKNLFLIDKGSAIVAGDPLYDLALVAITLPGALLEEKGSEADFLEAFIDGYGYNFTQDRQRFEGYVLLRSLERWPNQFEPTIPYIVQKIITQTY